MKKENRFKSGKIRTTKEENILLQKLFLEKGYKFLSGKTEPYIREELNYFYFEESGVISLGCKDDKHNNGDPFDLKVWSGETHFKKKWFKEYKAEDFLPKESEK